MYTLTLKGKFAAAHRLLDYDGDCGNLHGHTWKYEINIDAVNTQVKEDGLLVDFRELKAIEKTFDHTTILWSKDPLVEVLRSQEIKCFTLPCNPTAERLAEYIWERIRSQGKFSNKIFSNIKVTIWESDDAKVSYG